MVFQRLKRYEKLNNFFNGSLSFRDQTRKIKYTQEKCVCSIYKLSSNVLGRASNNLWLVVKESAWDVPPFTINIIPSHHYLGIGCTSLELLWTVTSCSILGVVKFKDVPNWCFLPSYVGKLQLCITVINQFQKSNLSHLFIRPQLFLFF